MALQNEKNNEIKDLQQKLEKAQEIKPLVTEKVLAEKVRVDSLCGWCN